jgi:pathogenesis-related protein 1
MNKVHVILFISFLLFLFAAEGLAKDQKAEDQELDPIEIDAGARRTTGKAPKKKQPVVKPPKKTTGKPAKKTTGKPAKKTSGKPPKSKEPKGKTGLPTNPIAGKHLNPNNLPEILIDTAEATLVYIVGKDTYNLDWVPLHMASALQILNTHNTFRKLIGIPALRWSYQLEQSAWNWVRNCVPAHDPKLEFPFGENMASVTSDYITLDDQVPANEPGSLEVGASQQWISEISSYDCRRNECRSDGDKDEVCGNFIQAAWNGTTHIGCAVMRCNQNSPFALQRKGPKRDYWNQITCRYFPPAWENERPFDQKKCAEIQNLSSKKKIDGLGNISTGYGPFGTNPGISLNSANAVTTGAARLIPKFGLEFPVGVPIV